MASGGMDTPFVWGQGGQKKTPQQVERDRLLAAALMREGSQYTPLGSWTQGLARLANGIVGGLESRWADEAEQAGIEGARARIDPLIAALTGGGSSYSAGASPVSSYAPSGAVDTGASSPMTSFSGNQQEFINALAPAAIQVGREIGVDPRVIIAQAAQETGWGRSAPGNNFFGIKSHGQGGGQTLNTHEYVNGQRVNVSDSFRTFASPEDSVRGYGDFITRNPRYEPFRTAQGLDAQLEALQASGYATDPNYSRSVGSIARGITLPDYAPTENAYAGTGMRDLRDRGAPEGFNPADAIVAPEVMRSSVPSSVSPEDFLLSPEAMTGRMGYAPQGSGISNADLMDGTALEAIEQAAPTSDPMAMALAAPSPAPVQVAQAGGGNDLLASILAAQADPWAQQQYGGMLNSLLSNELTRINQANDPLRQLQIQQAQANLNNTLNPWTARPATAEELAPWGIVPQPGESWTFGQDGLPQQVFAPTAAPTPIEVGGVLVDPITYEPIFDSRSPSVTNVDGTVIDNRTGQPIYQAPQQRPYEVIDGEVVYLDPQAGTATSAGSFGAPEPGWRALSPEEAAAYGIPAGTPSQINEGTGEIKGIGGVTVNNNLGDSLSPGWEAIDKGFADTYLSWTGGGSADIQAQLANLENALTLMESGRAETGNLVSALPREAQAWFNSDGLIARENVEETVQRSLRETLGAQFTEREGERLIQRAFNPLLPTTENIRRVNLLVGKIQEMAQAKDAMADYFRQNGTLMGYDGLTPSMSDLAQVESQFGDDPQGGNQGQSQANPQILNGTTGGGITWSIVE